MLRDFSAFLVLDYEEDIFRSFNSGSIDMRTESDFSILNMHLHLSQSR